MSDHMEVDASDVSKLSAALHDLPANSGRYLRSAITHTAQAIRDSARENARGLTHAPAFPRSITYDVGVNLDRSGMGGGIAAAAQSIVQGHEDANSTTLYAEIGPDKARPQGALGNLIEYGSVNNPPRAVMHGALQANEDDFERGVEIAIDDALKRLGL